MTTADEVRNLLALYCQHLDTGRPAELAALFDQDAELTVMGKAVHGRDAIRSWFADMAGAPALSVHHTTNTVLRVGDDAVTAHSNWITTRLGPTSRSWQIFAVGTYDDEFVHTPQGWRFARRIDSVLGDFTLDETITAYLAAD